LSRLGRRTSRLLTSAGTRREAQLEAALLGHRRGVSRTNTIAVASPRGGVGKTTCAFLLGDLIALRLALRVVVVDADPDFGTLGAMAPPARRCQRNVGHVLADLDRIESAAHLRPYVSALPSGLHLLAAPEDPSVMAKMTPERYGQLVAFLSLFYDVVLLDTPAGLSHPIARLAIARSDQTVLVTGPDLVAMQSVLGALRQLDHAGEVDVTVVLNKATGRPGAGAAAGRVLRRRGFDYQLTVPYDERLRAMLDSGGYALGELDGAIRVPVKAMALRVAGALV